MPKPVILTLDDEPQVLNAIERDLRQHYRQEYRILKAASGAEALETVQQLKQRNEAIALFLVDQRMPHMEGTNFLTAALTYYPLALNSLSRSDLQDEVEEWLIDQGVENSWEYAPELVGLG